MSGRAENAGKGTHGMQRSSSMHELLTIAAMCDM